MLFYDVPETIAGNPNISLPYASEGSFFTPAAPAESPHPSAETLTAAPAAKENGVGGDAPESYKPGPKRRARVMEYDMEDFFRSCVDTYAELTDTDPATYPKSGTPFGPGLTSFEDGQGGPRGEGDASPAEED